jgi:hypothetical protein
MPEEEFKVDREEEDEVEELLIEQERKRKRKVHQSLKHKGKKGM